MVESNSCALREDGTLKDAFEITFYHDIDDNVPLPPSTSDTLSAFSNAFTVLLNAEQQPANFIGGS